jgi:uncharacterized protein (DUF58 family)
MPTGASLELDPQAIARLKGLEVRARSVVDGFLSGQHRSHHRGQSVEFAEHREYAAGDDLRYVDWKAFGKTDRVYLKQFESETNLYCYLLVDQSESMEYRGPASALTKLQYAQCLAAAMAYLVTGQGDSVGLATFDEDVVDFVAASSNPAHVEHLIQVMQRRGSRGKSGFDRAAAALADRLRRRSLIVVLSDLLGSGPSLEHALRRLRHARHEVIVVQTLDAAELEFPFERTTMFRGLESLPSVLTEPHAVRKAYLAAMRQFLEQVQSHARSCQADYELARTDEPLDAPLRRLLTARLRRRR